MKMSQMPNAKDQRERLKQFLEFATDSTPGKCNFGAMLLFSPPGDVTFLAPIAPELRGVEIVSASPLRDDEKDYDIWKCGRPAKLNLTASEVLDWLGKRCRRSEAEYVANGGTWTEDTLHFYGAKPCSKA